MNLPTQQQALYLSKSALVLGHLGGHRAPRFFQKFIRNLKIRNTCEDHKRFLDFDATAQFKKIGKELSRDDK